MVTLTPQSKNSITMTPVNKKGTDITWAETSPETWGDQDKSTWAVKRTTLIEQSKNNISMSNQSKN